MASVRGLSRSDGVRPLTLDGPDLQRLLVKFEMDPAPAPPFGAAMLFVGKTVHRTIS